MTWLRVRSRAVATLALFAMVLQIAGTFGHVHVPTPPAFAKSLATANSAALPAVLAANDAAVTADAGAPPPGADSDALCPLCLVGHLVASAIAASAPTVAVPVVYARLAPLQVVSALDPSPVLTSFGCRGPPTS